MKSFKIKSSFSKDLKVEDLTDTEFIEQYIDLARFIVNKYIKLKEDREDVVQDCLIKLLENRSSINYEYNPKSYIGYMIRNCVINILKGKNKYHPLNLKDEEYLNNQEIYLEEPEISFESIKKVLNKKEYDIMGLYYQEGLTMEEIGNIYNVSRPSISKRIKSIKEKLSSIIIKQKGSDIINEKWRVQIEFNVINPNQYERKLLELNAYRIFDRIENISAQEKDWA